MVKNITINTHSSIKIAAEKIIYADPFKLTEALHDADIIYITHAHFDHFSPEDIEKAASDKTILVIPASMKEEAAKSGIPSERIITQNPGDTKEINGINTEAVPSYNTNKPMHPKSNGWLGYIITVNGTRIYIAGDTDATKEAEEVNCDIAMVPIGGTYTMDAKEAAELVNRISPRIAIPTHYGSLVGHKKDEKIFTGLLSENITAVIKL